MAEADDDSEDSGPKGSSSGKSIILILVGAIVLVFVSMGLTFVMLKSSGMLNPPGAGAHGADTGKQKPANYTPLEPAFVVNIKDANGRMRFLQVKMDLLTREEKGPDLIKQHSSAIRNAVVLILSTQTVEGLSNNEGKERLRALALEEIQKIMEAETGKKTVEAAFLSSIVMQ